MEKVFGDMLKMRNEFHSYMCITLLLSSSSESLCLLTNAFSTLFHAAKKILD